jgi:hypothetical protein
VWTFSIPLIYKESLCNGTEDVISDWYQQLTGTTPKAGDTISMSVSSVQPKTYTTRIDLIGSDDLFEGAHYYHDVFGGKTVWLCPVNQVLFGSVPNKIWVTFSKA